MAALSASLGAREYRSRDVTREFQREHPCPSTGLTSGACPRISEGSCCAARVRWTRYRRQHAVADDLRRAGKKQVEVENVRSVAWRLPALPCQHHTNLVAATLRTDQSLPPFGNRHVSAVAFGLRGGIGLDLMFTDLAP